MENVAARPSWIDLSGIKILWPHVFSSHSAPAYRDVQSVHNLLDTSNNNWGFHIYVHTWSPVFSALHSHQKINRYTTKCAFIIVQNYAICTEILLTLNCSQHTSSILLVHHVLPLPGGQEKLLKWLLPQNDFWGRRLLRRSGWGNVRRWLGSIGKKRDRFVICCFLQIYGAGPCICTDPWSGFFLSGKKGSDSLIWGFLSLNACGNSVTFHENILALLLTPSGPKGPRWHPQPFPSPPPSLSASV